MATASKNMAQVARLAAGWRAGLTEPVSSGRCHKAAQGSTTLKVTTTGLPRLHRDALIRQRSVGVAVTAALKATRRRCPWPATHALSQTPAVVGPSRTLRQARPGPDLRIRGSRSRNGSHSWSQTAQSALNFDGLNRAKSPGSERGRRVGGPARTPDGDLRIRRIDL